MYYYEMVNEENQRINILPKEKLNEFFREDSIYCLKLLGDWKNDEDAKNIAKAENDKKVAEIDAEKEYVKKTKLAKANAEATYIQAQKQAEANKLLAKSLTDPVLRQQLLNKWDGKFPNYVGGENGSFIFNMLEDTEKATSKK